MSPSPPSLLERQDKGCSRSIKGSKRPTPRASIAEVRGKETPREEGREKGQALTLWVLKGREGGDKPVYRGDLCFIH